MKILIFLITFLIIFSCDRKESVKKTTPTKPKTKLTSPDASKSTESSTPDETESPAPEDESKSPAPEDETESPTPEDETESPAPEDETEEISDRNQVTDNTPPIPGNSGKVEIANSTPYSIQLNWSKASDNITSEEDLRYKVFYSEESADHTTENIIEQGTPVSENFQTNINTIEITNLSIDTEYYFYLLVMDMQYNIAMYNIVIGSTLKAVEQVTTVNDLCTCTIFQDKCFFYVDDTWDSYLKYWDGGSHVDTIKRFVKNGQTALSTIIVKYGSKLYFSAEDAGEDGKGIELYSYDGTNIIIAADLNTNGSSFPHYMTVIDNNLYFSATDGSKGREVWKYDGTNFQQYDVATGSSGSNPVRFKSLNSVVYFTTNRPHSSTVPDSLYKIVNGTTSLVREDIDWTYLKIFNNLLFFRKNNSNNFFYDGTIITIFTKLNNLVVDEKSFFSGHEYKGKWYFMAADTDHGKEIWIFDGNNISLGFDINPGTNSSSPGFLGVLNDRLYFASRTEELGRELWEYDGTGQPRAYDLKDGTLPSTPSCLFSYKNNTYIKLENKINKFWR